eukprot:3179576-Karenia_brevis.AAC.1
MSGPEYDEPVVTPGKKDVKAVENENVETAEKPKKKGRIVKAVENEIVKNVSVEKVEKPKTKGGKIAIEEDEAENVSKRKSS